MRCRQGCVGKRATTSKPHADNCDCNRSPNYNCCRGRRCRPAGNHRFPIQLFVGSIESRPPTEIFLHGGASWRLVNMMPSYDHEPEKTWDEYDWERFLQKQDHKTEKYMELMEKYIDH